MIHDFSFRSKEDLFEQINEYYYGDDGLIMKRIDEVREYFFPKENDVYRSYKNFFNSIGVD